MEQVNPNQSKKRPKLRFCIRLLALFLAIVLVVETGIPAATKVSFSAQNYNDQVLRAYAAKLLEAQEEYLRQSNLEQGATYVQSLSNAEKFEVYASKASVAIGQEKYKEAADYVQLCLHFYPGESKEDLVILHLKLAGLYVLSGNLDKAAPELDEVLKLQPDNADALYLRIQLEVEKEDYAAAATDAIAYEACATPDKDTLKAFAGIYDLAGKTEQALACYTKLLEDPETAEADYHAARGRLRLLQGNVTDAITDLEDYFLKEGKDETGEIALLLCVCYLQAGSYESAKAAYDSATQAGAKPAADIKNWMAAACLTLEDYDTADKLLDEVLAENPTYEGAAYLKGICLFSLEKTQEAVDFLTLSIEREEEKLNSLYYRGVSYLRLGKQEEAKADLEIVAAQGEGENAASAKEILGLLNGEEKSE